MLRFIYRHLPDFITGRLKIADAGASEESGSELGPAVQYTQMIDREGNESLVTEQGSIPVALRDTEVKRMTWAQLTAAGSTSALNVKGFTQHTLFVTLAATDTSVDVSVEGRIVGSTWANLDDSNADTQFDTDDTYQFHAKRVIDEIRFTFVSEAGGAAATLDISYVGLP